MPELTYQSVAEFVRSWSTDRQNSPYDFNATVHLMLAALDNIRENAMEHELKKIGHSMTDDQRLFLEKIADFGCNVTDSEIEIDDN